MPHDFMGFWCCACVCWKFSFWAENLPNGTKNKQHQLRRTSRKNTYHTNRRTETDMEDTVSIAQTEMSTSSKNHLYVSFAHCHPHNFFRIQSTETDETDPISLLSFIDDTLIFFNRIFRLSTDTSFSLLEIMPSEKRH